MAKVRSRIRLNSSVQFHEWISWASYKSTSSNSFQSLITFSKRIFSATSRLSSPRHRERPGFVIALSRRDDFAKHSSPIPSTCVGALSWHRRLGPPQSLQPTLLCRTAPSRYGHPPPLPQETCRLFYYLFPETPPPIFSSPKPTLKAMEAKLNDKEKDDRD